METTEINTQDLPNIEPDIILTPEAQYYLQQAGKWASFLGIMGFIASGLLVIAAIFATTLMSTMSAMSPSPVRFNFGPLLGIVYFFIAIFYFFFSLYLYQFGTKIKSGIAFIDSAQVTAALNKLKSFFKLWGITTIVIIALYALIIIISIIGIAAFRH